MNISPELILSINSSAGNESIFNLLPQSKLNELTAWTVITLLISFLGALNNMVALTLSWWTGLRDSILNLLLFHFVAVNLFMCLVSYPLSILTVVLERARFPMTDKICHYIHTIYGIIVGVIHWSDAGLAVNRCMAVFAAPHRYKQWCSKRNNLRGIACCWIICCVTVPTNTFGVKANVMVMTRLGQCEILPAVAGHFDLNALVLVFIPSAVAGLEAGLILWKSLAVWRFRRSNIQSTGRLGADRSVIRQLYLAKLLMVTFLWSGLCSAPTFVVAVHFPWLLLQDPVSILWIKTCLPLQYGCTPVCLMNRVLYIVSCSLAVII